MADERDAHRAVADLLARCHRLGSDPRNTNYAGGNASAKVDALDPATGQHVRVLYVKGSGGDLGTLTESGLAALELEPGEGARRRLPGTRARGRDGRPVRLLPLRSRRGRAEHRHGHACTRRLAARRSPPPRLDHRVGDRRRRPGADEAVLRRRGPLGRLAAARVPARTRHRRAPCLEPDRHRLHPGRTRSHDVGRDER